MNVIQIMMIMILMTTAKQTGVMSTLITMKTFPQMKGTNIWMIGIVN